METTNAKHDDDALSPPPPARPAELSVEFLQEVLAPSTGDASGIAPARVVAFDYKALEVGVISEVVGLTVHVVLDQDPGRTQERALIAKFLRPEFPFEKMFVVESNFYRGLGRHHELAATSALFPFALPTAVYLSKSLIILERVTPVQTFSCVTGCPRSHIEGVVTRLAQMHGRFWTADCSDLAVSAGIGSELSGEAKRDQFPSSWAAFLEDVPLDPVDRERVKAICEHLSRQPELLAAIHEQVATGPSTLIHGDFHTANLLFPVTGSDDPTVWLVDWATCGKGNPMRDLAFFFIVGVTPEDRRATEAASLEGQYVEAIVREGVTHLTREDWWWHYRACVVNQFLILVVYDSLSKHLASNAKGEKLRQELHVHFREVNVRACLALVDHFSATAFAPRGAAM